MIAAFAIDCSSNGRSQDHLPCIDVEKNYPQKEVILTDIANITYVHLSTENSDYLFNGGIVCITENNIVVNDHSSGSILFFSRNGNPKSRFNHVGNGPKEYSDRMFFITYDETADDVFVNVPNFFSILGQNSIPVYSSTGVYKRELILPASPFPLVDFDDQSLFLYDMQNQRKKIFSKGMRSPTQSIDSSYRRISKVDGKVLEYVDFPSDDNDLTNRGNGHREIIGYMRVVKCTEGLFLCNPETDTVFLYGKDKVLTPMVCKTPLVSKLDPVVVLMDFVDVGKYQFIQTQTLANSDKMDYKGNLYKFYCLDKQTGEIFHSKINIPDYPTKDFFISAANTYFDGKVTLAYFELDLIEIKQAYKENKLSGKLKELVATLKEDDNNVYVIAEFK